jgi:diacylglycerol kinase family enzyme
MIEYIDCGKINDTYFFSNAGFGFDAQAVKIYAHQRQRQLWGYIKCIFLSVFKFKPIKISLHSVQEQFSGKIMMLNISNSNCLGYGFSLSPQASLQDGQLDINFVKKCSWATFSWIGIGFLINKKLGKKRKSFNTDKLKVEISVDYMQIDGEYTPLKSRILDISILPGSLPVLVG